MAIEKIKMSADKGFSRIPFILITSLFLVWGLANNMTDTLLAAFKRIMGMTDFQTSWIQVAFYGSYFCLAVPAALFIRRFSYKSGVLLGLGLFIVGSMLFYPASLTMRYGHFLMALFVLAGGLAVLETTANPYVLVMGPEKTATRRLNLAQSFNPIGSVLGILMGKFFILSNLDPARPEERGRMDAEVLASIQETELNAVMMPYVMVAIVMVLLWTAIFFVKMPKATGSSQDFNISPAIKSLLNNRNYLWGIVAQFFYVGAQIGVWSFTIRYVMRQMGIDEASAANYYVASLVVFMASRFICTFLMKFVRPQKLMVFLSMVAAILTLLVIFVGSSTGVYALVGISACMSLMYPTIFGLAVGNLGNNTKVASSGLVMAILGGAVLTPLQGYFSDVTKSINYSFFVPFVCFVVVTLYGLGCHGSRDWFLVNKKNSDE